VRVVIQILTVSGSMSISHVYIIVEKWFSMFLGQRPKFSAENRLGTHTHGSAPAGARDVSSSLFYDLLRFYFQVFNNHFHVYVTLRLCLRPLVWFRLNSKFKRNIAIQPNSSATGTFSRTYLSPT